MNKYLLVAVAVIILAAGGFYLYQSRSQTTTPVMTTTPSPMVTTEPSMEPSPTATASSAAVKEFTVTGSAFKFNPAEIRVKKGDMVKITFKNAGGIHDLVIDELNVATKQLQAGMEETVEFTASTAGSFEYYCSVGNHRAMGMKGMLIVE